MLVLVYKTNTISAIIKLYDSTERFIQLWQHMLTSGELYCTVLVLKKGHKIKI